MYIGVNAVKPQEDYVLLLTFENGEQRRFDMKPFLDIGPVFRALKDPQMFQTVHVCFHTIAWKNNADLDPEILYPNSCPV
jgi:hypothetical protein